MTVSNAARLTLEEFLALPETKPASEYVEGEVLKKPMPKTRHSRLQAKLINAINAVAEPGQIAYGFPELRCSFAERSIIPDIAVLRWSNIRFDANGEPLDDVLRPPDWTIEILSPDQSANRVMGNILHCLNHGCRLGWLVDPGDRSVLVFRPQQQPELCHGEAKLVVLEGIELALAASQVFGWLRMN
ncbi:MAG: Uma2 family endonuclease [Elainellaceae cyanobacterium]